MTKPGPIVYVISDSAGETGEAVVRAAAAQFHPQHVDIRRFPFVEHKDAIDKAVELAIEHHAILVFTLVIPELRDYLIERCAAFRITHIDLLNPIITSLEKMLGSESRHKPGMVHRLDEDYFKKVEAVEFAVKYDDGRDPRGILKADIVLVGVSRTSKTPLSMYLAHKKYKVANVPLVPEIKAPNELFDIPSNRIIGLRIDPSKLNSIRKERLKSLGLATDAQYANLERIMQELEYSARLFQALGCVVIDVSNKAVEETAGVILDLYRS